MPTLSLDRQPSTSTAHSRRLPVPVASGLLISVVVSFLAGSAAPTPLFSTYQGEWGFSAITITVIFGIYALAVLSALLTVGSLSDHIGRRPVLLTGIALQAIAMLILASATGVDGLLLGRVVQGLATGMAASAIGAGLLDINRARGTLANAVATPTGTATGALFGGLLVQYLPAPTRLVYLALLVIFLLQGVGVVLMAETATRAPGALASLRPEFAAPPRTRRAMSAAVPALTAAFALVGLYGALGPALVRRLSGSSAPLLGGLPLFALAGASALTVLVLRDIAPPTVMGLGVLGLMVGTIGSLAAVALSSAAGFFVGTVVAGIGFGGAFQGAIRTVLPLAEQHERAGVLAVIYTVCYLAIGLPAVIAARACRP